jgi:predicted RNase H-like HicB family nuclease
MSDKKILTYTVVFEEAEEGGYIASVPMLAGCLSQGETVEEARENIKEAIGAYLESLRKHDEEIPVEIQALHSSVSVAT